MVEKTSEMLPHGPSRILSLKWKAMLLTSAVLIIITAAFSGLSYFNLISQFRQQRELIHQRQEQELNGLIAQSLVQLKHLAGTIQNLKDMSPALQLNTQDALYSAFDKHWIALQLEYGLDVARFYNVDNQLTAAWGQSGLPEVTQLPTPNWVIEANADERPITGVDCSTKCTIFAVSPILISGRHVGAVLIGSPMTDIVLGFKNFSDADVGLIITSGQDDAVETIDDRSLPNWQSKVAALTNFKQNVAILKHVSHQYPNISELIAGISVGIEDRHYELKLKSIEDTGHLENAQFVLISDITTPLANIGVATRENLLLGGLGMMASVLLLLALLWRPMTRLRVTAETLPLLGVGAFERARSSIMRRVQHHHWFKDEIDNLDSTAIELSWRLEKLEHEVSDRTRDLNERMNELRRERDFVNSLLNTAQVMVLTQDIDHRIRMLNQYGEMLSGYRANELINIKVFEDLIVKDDITLSISKGLTELAEEGRDQFRHEAQLSCKDGAYREIAWLHSKLGIHGDDEPVILSIGLDVTEQKQAEQRLSWLADHDSLCGLYNRRRFQEELERALAETRRYGHQGALLFFDLDQFKYINDTSGHQAGDMLLKIVANTLTNMVRDTDIVGRLGGDEFAVLIGHTNEDGAVKTIKKICATLGAIHLPVGERSYRVSVSAGVALFPQHGTDVHEVLANADLAMYQAKDAGRNRWHLFSSEDPGRKRMQAQVYWKERVEKALMEDRFVLHFQPILDLHTNNITHVEALLRMVDADKSLVPPGAFIDACERTGLIHDIDHLVLHKGIQQIAQLNEIGYDIRVALNLSGRVFEDPDLLSMLSDLLERYDVSPKRLIFEITETAAVADFVAARYLMNSIRSMGCSFALDDFGTGFSSLRYLKQLPADYVKIDGSFIRDLYDNHDEQVLVRAITDVAKGFGKKTIAEFVERSEVLKMLRSYGVDYAQGYRVGRPVAAENLVLNEEVNRQVNAV